MVSGKTDEFDYNLIKTMNEVIVSGNLSRAATNLNLSVSAVSSSLKKLRQHFGGELFYRTVNGLKPTRAALEINDSFSKAIFIIESAVKNKELMQSGYSTLKVICPDVLENYFGADKNDNIEFADHGYSDHDDVIQHFLHKNIDILAGNIVLHHERVVTQKMAVFDDFVIVCSANSILASQDNFTLTQYYTLPHVCYCHRLLGPEKAPFGGKVYIDAPYSGNIRTAYMSSSISGVIHALEHSNMLAVLPRKIARHFIHDRQCPLVEFNLPDEVKIICPPLYVNYLFDEDRGVDISELIKYPV